MQPTMNTPVDVVILVLTALAPWLKTHKDALDLHLSVELDEPDEVLAVARALELASDAYNREVREDVAQTAARADAISRSQTVLRGVIATADQRLKAAGAHERAIKDFSTVAPSRLIYIPTLRKALRAARLASITNQAILDADGKPRSQHMILRMDESIAQLDKVAEDDVREEQETRIARRTFEIAHEHAIAAIDALHSAAESAVMDTDAPLNDLAPLYDSAHHRAAARRAPTPDAPQGPTDDLG
jgi:hypothetical protein